MLFGICQLTSPMPIFWHTYLIMYGDFMVIVEPCTLSGLRQLLVTENPLKMVKNAFYFTLKALFVLKIFKFLS